MEASPFARLSSELRNTIYEFAFNNSNYAVTLQHNAVQHGIPRTCSQLRHETLDMYYSLARFNAHLDDGPLTPLARWLMVLGRNTCLLLREVNVWGMHMLNATLHGVESTGHLLRSTTADGRRYVLQPTGSWLAMSDRYLRDLVVALHDLGLEICNSSRVSVVPEEEAENQSTVRTGAGCSTRPERTSHFAIVPKSDDALLQAPRCQLPDLRDSLAHRDSSRYMVEEVFDGLEGSAETSV